MRIKARVTVLGASQVCHCESGEFLKTIRVDANQDENYGFGREPGVSLESGEFLKAIRVDANQRE
jgi:hypothetical protein